MNIMIFKLNKMLLSLIVATLIRILILPISVLIPKKRNRIIFLSSDRPYYENLGVTFEYMAPLKNLDIIYIAKRNSYFNKDFRDKIILYPSFKSIYKLITASVIIMDAGIPRFAGIFAFRAKRIQLWHGNGIKKIGWIQHNFRNEFKRNLMKLWIGYIYGFIKYDIVYFTSEYSFKHRKNAFIFKEYKFNGQPRNDLIFKETKKSKEYIRSLIPNYINYKKIIYVPTWRERKDEVNIFEKHIDFYKINDYCKKNNIMFIVKFHPLEKLSINFNNLSNIVILDKQADIYNLLYYIDVLITDYSSVYFDYLLLDRPIIFFPFDKKDYLTNQRDIVYNYDEVTPGRQCFTTSELIEEINNIIIKNKDLYKEKRKELTNLFYKYKDNRSRERVKLDILELLNLE